ncbi:MAG: 30S ribosomal protein S18 [Chloroflexi bacterium]|nr:30S ribosomal protein S18 [Chloroflexota bacterium]MBM3182697.1 30S ribosomal protein S18 [Chloroflexota bacterium]MBM4452689.1 30S ribosomal protein S18 [Chloroflexota bacterium]MBM4454704.1 30S ribosomal protein S18 [Chloroflexota bacterium]
MAQGEAYPKVSRERPRRFTFKPKVCALCAEKSEIGYKDIAKLRRYVSDRGRIQPRRRTGACAKHQRRLALAIKRARFLALLPSSPEHVYNLGELPKET